MRPFVLACAAIAVASAPDWMYCIHAQDWLREAIPLESRTHDFGTVARAAKTEHRFLIRNNLDADMHLRAVRTSCGCTTPIIETEWIKPGETGSILARFNTGTFTGSKSATLTVSIDRPTFTELQLNVRGYIRSDVVLNPGEINFGEIPMGEPKTMEVMLDYAGRNDWQLLSIDCPLDSISVTFTEVMRSGGRIQYKIAASIQEDAPVGIMRNQLLLRTNDRNLTTVPIRFMADVQSPIQISPQAFALGMVKPGAPIQQRLAVKAREEFRITDIRSEQAEIRFEPVDKPKLAHLLNITIVPQAQEQDGEVKGEVLLFTDLIDEPIRLGLSYNQVTQSSASSVAQAD